MGGGRQSVDEERPRSDISIETSQGPHIRWAIIVGGSVCLDFFFFHFRQKARIS